MLQIKNFIFLFICTIKIRHPCAFIYVISELTWNERPRTENYRAKTVNILGKLSFGKLSFGKMYILEVAA